MADYRRVLACVFVAAAVLSTGVAEAKKKTKGKREPIYPITGNMVVSAICEILVLPVKVETKLLQERAHARQSLVQEREIAGWLHGISLSSLEQKGFTASSTADSGLISEVERLTELSDQFVRARLGPDASPDLLRPFSSPAGCRAMLFQSIEVELSSKGYYEAFTGGMKVGMSNSNLRGALRDCDSGELLWRGELYIRTVPRVGDDVFEQAVVRMYDNLLRQEE